MPRFVWAALFGFAVLAVGVSLSPWRSGYADAADRGAGDVQLYAAEVARIAAGEAYYEAAARELRARGYPTGSVFNWRTPLPMWLVGRLPHPLVGRAMAGCLAISLLMASCLVIHRECPVRVSQQLAYETSHREGSVAEAMLCLMMMIGAVMPCFFSQAFTMPVVWAGVLIGLSLCCYGLERPYWGVACGLAALFVRDLAGPYCALMALMALQRRAWRELTVWGVGLAAYAAFFAWHFYTVQSLIGPGDEAHAEGWIQSGGLPFVLSVAQMNCYLLQLPQWVTAIYLGLSLLGFAGWNSQTGRRMGFTACGYLALFALIGQPFNQYWGTLVGPLLCLGFARSLGVTRQLARWEVGRWGIGVDSADRNVGVITRSVSEGNDSGIGTDVGC